MLLMSSIIIAVDVLNIVAMKIVNVIVMSRTFKDRPIKVRAQDEKDKSVTIHASCKHFDGVCNLGTDEYEEARWPEQRFLCRDTFLVDGQDAWWVGRNCDCTWCLRRDNLRYGRDREKLVELRKNFNSGENLEEIWE